jgi:hypothetical protein
MFTTSSGGDESSSSAASDGASTTSASASATTDDSAPTDASASGESSDSTDDASDATSSDTGPLLDIGGAESTGTAEGGGGMGCEKVDLLFVIDDSGSMSDNQDKLTQAFPGMAQTIDDTLVVGQGIDYRIGVISSNILDDTACLLGMCGPNFLGRLQHTEARVSCSDVPAGRWIEGSEGPTSVAEQFTCIASLNMALDLNGIPEGSSEQPLEATRMALIDRVSDQESYNQGFLRSDALLVMIIVTDEDDQSVWQTATSWDLFGGPGSLAPVSDFYDMVVGLKGDHPENVAVVAISGPASGGGETDAPRVHDFLALAGANTYWADISGNDYSTALGDALALIEGSCDGFIPPG